MGLFQRIKPPAQQSTTVAEVQAQSEEKLSVYKALDKALAEHGVAIKNYGSNWARIPAVWRNSRERNISVCLKSGTAVDFADGNRRIEFHELMTLLGGSADNVDLKRREHSEVVSNIAQRIASAVGLMKRGVPISATTNITAVAVKYLRSRGLPDSTIKRVEKDIRAVPGDFGGIIMLSPVFSATNHGSLIAVQRTFLDHDGKKDPDRPRAFVGTQHVHDKCGGYLIRGDETRFNERTVAITEGLETGMAVHAATGMPVYVVYNANGIKSFDVEYLSSLGVTGIIICADNDDPDKYGRRAGQDSAKEMATRISTDYNCSIKIALPGRKLTNGAACDWLDIWNLDPVGCGRMILSAPEFVPQEESKPAMRNSMRSLFNKHAQ